MSNNADKHQGLSNANIGFPENGRSLSLNTVGTEINQITDVRRVKSKESVNFMSESRESYLGDSIACFAYCSNHKKIVMTTISGKGLWLPMMAMNVNDSWKLTAILLLKTISDYGIHSKKPNFAEPEIMQILRIQVPQTCNFVRRIIFRSLITSDSDVCCQNIANHFCWKTFEEVVESDHLWGPEPKYFIGKITKKSPIKKQKQGIEFDLNDAKLYIPREKPRNKEEDMLKSAMFKEEDIIKVYHHFIQHCYPSQWMTITSFGAYMHNLGWDISNEKIRLLFRAFDFNSQHYLGFYELLLGLAAIDQVTTHGGSSLELRCGYIFRYYDSDGDGILSHSDVNQMMSDIMVAKDLTPQREDVERDTNALMTQLKTDDRISYEEFLNAVGKGIRGTSDLLRSPIPTLQQISFNLYFGSSKFSTTPAGIVTKRRYTNKCQKCKTIKYQLAPYCFRLDISGKIIENKNIENIRNTRNGEIPVVSSTSDITSLAHTMINKIRQFDSYTYKRIGTPHDNHDNHGKNVNFWFYKTKEEQHNAIKLICENVKEIFTKEERIISITSPCFIMGDIHGNLLDLITYDRVLWRTAPSLTPNNYLFLGDYVDRGEFGVECVTYLFSQKIISPKNFFMCRGNHEVRSLQEMFTFQTECRKRFNEEIWECFNEVFDTMPIAAVIDESIYCAHGGIPTDTTNIEKVKCTIPVPMYDPEIQSSNAWQILWNDPVDTDEFDDLVSFLKINPSQTRGFLDNTKRGTGYLYSEEAVNNFLQTNGLSHIVRGHEVMMHGYKFHMKGKVITVFSSSRYCGTNNCAASIFVDQEKLRVIRIET